MPTRQDGVENRDKVYSSFFLFTFLYSTVLPQANHELALQDAAKKANKQRGEIEEQIADMKVLMVIDM